MREAIILAAGVGSRLAAVHDGQPKCLVPVGGVPILERQLRALAETSVSHVVIVTGYEAEQVRQAATGLGLPMRLTFVDNPEYRTTNVLRSWMIGSEILQDDHYYMHADTVFEQALIDRLESESADDTVVLTVDRHECGDEEMKVVADGDRVRRISKQLDPSTVLGEFTGVLRAPASLLPTLRALSEEVLGGPGGRAAFFEAALQHGLDQSKLSVRWVDVTGVAWREVDFPEDLRAAERLFASSDGAPS